MPRLWTSIKFCLLGALLAFTSGNLHAQKPLAPGVLQIIPTGLDPRDSFSLPMPMPGLNPEQYDPQYLPKNETLYGQSQRVVMFRDVWEYEFSFLGQLRQAKLLVPDLKSGQPVKKNVWYLIYRIRDFGRTLTYEQVKQTPEFDHIKYDLKRDGDIPSENRFFLPRFTLEGWTIDRGKDGYSQVAYRDEVSPMVLRQIQRREDPSLNLIDSVEMSQTKIPRAKNDADGGVWGVAIFENVDPRIDFVSVYVTGLTNAFRLSKNYDQPNLMKTLQLNFWRPGDILDEDQDRIDYGIPLVDNPQRQILITERYHLPGPLVRGYHINREAADLEVLITETDAEVSLTTFQSAITPTLDKGQIPPTVLESLKNAGYPAPPQYGH